MALLAWIGYLHLHLWLEGYRQIPTDGPLFLLDAVAAFALAAGLLVWPAPLAGLAAAGYTASTLGALLISLTVGLLRESISASYVTESLAIETITLAALVSWTILAAVPHPAGPPAASSAPVPQRQPCPPAPARSSSTLTSRQAQKAREQESPFRRAWRVLPGPLTITDSGNCRRRGYERGEREERRDV